MQQVQFVYQDAANDEVLSALAVSIFADRAHLRDVIGEDVRTAGLRIRRSASLGDLAEGEAQVLADVVLVDCPVIDGAALAGLSRLDLDAARCGAKVVVSTSLASLDDVFACMESSNPQILVDPSRAERVVALGRVLALACEERLRELSDDDRLMLLRLTEQVTRIAQRLEALEGSAVGPAARNALPDNGAFAFEAAKRAFHGADADLGDRLVRATRPPLPDPRLVRRIIRQRQLRARFFDGDLFADPAWDMLLDLTAARAEHSRVSVTSLCIASNVPPTTALRWIGQMTEAGLFQRVEDETDRRRAFIALTDTAADGMARYFSELGTGAARVV